MLFFAGKFWRKIKKIVRCWKGKWMREAMNIRHQEGPALSHERSLNGVY